VTVVEPPDGPLYRVRHHYRYVYTGPIYDVRQRLIMIPPDVHGDQTLVSFDLDVRGTRGPLSIEWQSDDFGNRVCRVEAAHVDHALDFEARFTVRRAAAPRPPLLRDESRQAFGAATALTAPDERILAAARSIAERSADARRRAELASDWAAGAITYKLSVTGTQTPAAMALHLGQGVFQDYAPILLAVLRLLEIPARYVSGHLLGEGAPHAWVEAVLTDEVIGYDPTHRRRVTSNYITVAVGRDFADVTTTSGVFSGAATGKLHWSKQAERVDPAALPRVAEAAA